MLKYNIKKQKCSDLRINEFPTNESMLTVKPHSAEEQLTCFKSNM